MTERELLIRHSPTIIRGLFKSMNSTIKRFYKFSDTSYKAEVGTSQYWKSVAGMEQTQNEIDELLKQLKAMDNIAGWHSKLHQDRYLFIKKYDDVLKRYEESAKEW